MTAPVTGVEIVSVRKSFFFIHLNQCMILLNPEAREGLEIIFCSNKISRSRRLQFNVISSPDRQMSRPANVATGKCRDRQMSRPANVATGKCRDRQMLRPAEFQSANVAIGKCRDRQMSRPANVAIGKSPTGKSPTGEVSTGTW